MPLTSEVRRSPEPSARPGSAAADSEERQICTTCLFAESVGLCLCFLPSCAMYKDNAVRNVVAEMGRDLVFMITARLSDLSMPLKGEVLRSPVQRQRCSKRGSGDGQRLSLYDYGTTERSFHAVERWGSTLTCTVCTAADSEERQICTTCLFAESVGLWKRQRSYLYVCFLYAFSCMLSPIVVVEHISVWEGVRGRGEIWRGIPQSNTKDQLPKPQTATVTVATAQRPK